MKLSHQFRSGETGGKRISDTVGAGSKDWDEKLKGLVTPEVRERAKTSVQDMLMQPSKPSRTLTAEEQLMAKRKTEDDLKEEEKHSKKRRIFDGLVIYINGSTHPIISDHKLKHTLAENGARLSLHLGRRQVTHVILGRSSGLNSGAGGELSGTKMEKEIRRVCGCGVKYVGVEWVLESIKSGKRLSETGFLNLKVANKGQQSVYGYSPSSSHIGCNN
jgi:hypothetical protein